MNAIWARQVAISCGICLLAGGTDAYSATDSMPVMQISPIIPLNPQENTELSISFTSQANIPKHTGVLIRGMPKMLSLTTGRRFNSGVWWVPLKQISELKIAQPVVPIDFEINLSISLVTLNGRVLAEEQTILTARRQQANAESEVINRAEQQDPDVIPTQVEIAALDPDDNRLRIFPTANTGLSSNENTSSEAGKQIQRNISDEQEALHLKKGQEALALNDIAGARLIFKYLARSGSASGAYQLAQTYDPEIRRNDAIPIMVKTNADAAAKWYSVAAELGHPDAAMKINGRR